MLNFDGELWKEVRCSNCRRLLCYENIHFGRIMHKCKYCKEVTVVRYKTEPKMLQKLINTKQIDGNPDNELILNQANSQINNEPLRSESGDKEKGK